MGAYQWRKAAWRASALIGDPRFGTGILCNPLYRGRAVGGQTKCKRSKSDSTIRIPVPMPESEWVVKDMPQLRIVSDELFDMVQALQSQDSPLKQAIRRGIRMSPRRGKGSY
jgi:site-specific DNA recombinase